VEAAAAVTAIVRRQAPVRESCGSGAGDPRRGRREERESRETTEGNERERREKRNQ
jgi:hypothetical protein